MNDQELIRQFIAVERTPAQIAIKVCQIRWPHPHNPESHWHVAMILAPTATESETEAAVGQVLHDRRYFRVCEECGTRQPDGWMFGDAICQSCAERNHGVVY